MKPQSHLMRTDCTWKSLSQERNIIPTMVLVNPWMKCTSCNIFSQQTISILHDDYIIPLFLILWGFYSCFAYNPQFFQDQPLFPTQSTVSCFSFFHDQFVLFKYSWMCHLLHIRLTRVYTLRETISVHPTST